MDDAPTRPERSSRGVATANPPNDSQLERQLNLLNDQTELISRLRTRLGDVSVANSPPLNTPGQDRGLHISDMNARIVESNDSLRVIIDELAI